jgi:PadR family transcriptional regulator AphA
MKRDLHFCWPRAERGIYYEPKNLVAHGLATASIGRTGKRKRTVYSITPAGRHAFERWLEQDAAASPQLESETILRATFAHRGSKDALLGAIAIMREQGATMRYQLTLQARQYADTGGPFPDQLHLIALTGRFLIDYASLLEDWADWAEAHVRDWPSVKSASEVSLDFAYEIFAELGAPAPNASKQRQRQHQS